MNKFKKYIVIFSIILVLAIIGAIGTLNESKKINSNATNSQKETSTEQSNSTSQPKEEIKVTKVILRFGNNDIPKDYKRGFDYEDYKVSAVDDLKNTTENPEEGETIDIPFQQSVEVEVQYEQIELKADGIFSTPNIFTAEAAKGSNVSSGLVNNAGGGRAFHFNNQRAIVLFHPSVYVPYGDGGTTKLILKLETKNNTKVQKEWIFKVGKNPAVYPNQ